MEDKQGREKAKRKKIEGSGGREGGRRGVSSLCVLLYNVHVCTYL